MITKNKYGRDYKNMVTIERVHEYELDEAIEDLEKRGYALVNRGLSEMASHHMFRKKWARMKKT